MQMLSIDNVESVLGDILSDQNIQVSISCILCKKKVGKDENGENYF